MDSIRNFILDQIAPIIKLVIKEVIKLLFTNFLKKEPVHGKVAIVSLYPIIDVELEPLTEKTLTEYDDAIVDGVKEGLEEVAQEHGIVLPELDED